MNELGMLRLAHRLMSEGRIAEADEVVRFSQVDLGQVRQVQDMFGPGLGSFTPEELAEPEPEGDPLGDGQGVPQSLERIIERELNQLQYQSEKTGEEGNVASIASQLGSQFGLRIFRDDEGEWRVQSADMRVQSSVALDLADALDGEGRFAEADEVMRSVIRHARVVESSDEPRLGPDLKRRLSEIPELRMLNDGSPKSESEEAALWQEFMRKAEDLGVMIGSAPANFPAGAEDERFLHPLHPAQSEGDEEFVDSLFNRTRHLFPETGRQEFNGYFSSARDGMRRVSSDDWETSSDLGEPGEPYSELDSTPMDKREINRRNRNDRYDREMETVLRRAKDVIDEINGKFLGHFSVFNQSGQKMTEIKKWFEANRNLRYYMKYKPNHLRKLEGYIAEYDQWRARIKAMDPVSPSQIGR